VSGLLARGWRAFDALLLWRLRRWRERVVERATPKIAERLYTRASRVANLPFRSEVVQIPRASTVDVVADLAAFTGLPRTEIENELTTRSSLSFRAEWHATPRELRRDHWFYLSAKGYLFANAIHFPDTAFVDDFVRPNVQSSGRVLDFGGGTGNLALALAAAGYVVTVSELNALQRDFIRFRVARHGLGDRVTVLDWWDGMPKGVLDAVVAVDVLEHLAEPRTVIGEQLVPALKPEGVLVENSPFVINAANPMHHEDYGFEAHMRSEGFEPGGAADDGTRVWKRATASR
jgi:SAM-dependent methyltransferase